MGTFSVPPVLAVLTVLAALAAAFTLLNPRSPALLALCTLIPLHAFAEAPVVGNNWILSALVSLCFVIAALQSRKSSAIAFATPQVLWAARTTVLVAYAFAAFAKLNWDFVDPAVSCVPIFQDRLVTSLGLPQLSVLDKPAWGHGFAIMTIVVELAVAALLALRPTRRLGLALAFGFHGVLAFDLAQHFWDFSSLLFAGFFLFFDREQLGWLSQKLSALAQPLQKYRPKPELLGAGVLLLGLFVGVMASLPRDLGYGSMLQQLGHSAWWVYGPLCMLAAVAALFAPRAHATPEPRLRLAPALLLPAALAFFNGLTPYLELKTGFGWNMYSNLRTVAGQSNHMLIPATLDLLGAQRDLVTIVKSSDPTLQQLHDKQYGLTYSQFVSYAHRFPESSATYQWRGQTVNAKRLADDPAGQAPYNIFMEKLWSYRIVDLQPKQRCQPSFTPAQ